MANIVYDYLSLNNVRYKKVNFKRNGTNFMNIEIKRFNNLNNTGFYISIANVGEMKLIQFVINEDHNVKNTYSYLTLKNSMNYHYDIQLIKFIDYIINHKK